MFIYPVMLVCKEAENPSILFTEAQGLPRSLVDIPDSGWDAFFKELFLKFSEGIVAWKPIIIVKN